MIDSCEGSKSRERRRKNGHELNEKNEEIEIYKERLREIETAFKYNLRLLSDRDEELEELENKLRSGVLQMEKMVHEREDYEEFVRKMDQKHVTEMKSLKHQMALKEKRIKDLERKNEGSHLSVKQTVEELKREQKREISRRTAQFEAEKRKIEKNFIDLMKLKDAKHLDEINQLKRKYLNHLDEVTREKQHLSVFRTENKGLRQKLTELEEGWNRKEKSYLTQIRQLSHLYGQASKELEKVLDDRQIPQVKSESTLVRPETDVGVVQTENEDSKRMEMILHQNEVLRCVIKEMKKKEAAREEEKQGCVECVGIKSKVEETSKKFEHELKELKHVLEGEKAQRTEEEAILQKLESSVVCLKERLMNGVQGSPGDYSEIQVEDRLNRKLEMIINAVETERENVNRKLEAVKTDCMEKVSRLLESKSGSGVDVDRLLEKVREEIRKLEVKIQTDIESFSKVVNSKGVGLESLGDRLEGCEGLQQRELRVMKMPLRKRK